MKLIINLINVFICHIDWFKINVAMANNGNFLRNYVGIIIKNIENGIRVSTCEH